MATQKPPSIAQEADLLETEINQAHLPLDQEIGIWSVYGNHGLVAAQHALTAHKEAKSPTLMRQKALGPDLIASYKATMTPADDFDRLGQQLAQAARTAALQPGASQTQVLEYVQSIIAQLAPVAGRATMTDSGDLSVAPATKKKQAPSGAPQSVYEALVKGEPLSTVPATKSAPVDAFAVAVGADQVRR